MQSTKSLEAAQDFTRQAEAFLGQNNFAGAIEYSRRAIELDADAFLPYHCLGYALFRQGQVDESIPCYHQVLALNPSFSWSHQGLGEAFHFKGQLNDAIACYKQAIQLKPDFFWSYQYLGEALAFEGLIDEAISSYKKALELDPSNTRTHYRLGDVLMHQGRVDEAREFYRKAEVLQPDNLDKGYIFTQDWFTPNVPTLAQYLNRFRGQANLNVLEIGSFEGRSTCWMLDNILLHETATITCIDPFKPYLSLNNLILLHLKFAEKLFDYNTNQSGDSYKVKKIKGDSQVILPTLNTEFYDSIYIDGDHRASRVLLDASLCWRLLKVDGLMIFDDYEHKPSANPDEDTKIGVDIFLSIFADQIEVLHKGYQLIIKKTLGLVGAEAYQKLGKALFERGFASESTFFYKRAIELNPASSLSYYCLGEALYTSGDIDQAICHLYKSIELNPNFFWANQLLGQALAKKWQLDEAIQFYRRAIELDSNCSWSYHHLGQALSARGQWNEAVDCYRLAIQLNPGFYGSYQGLALSLTNGDLYRVLPWVKEWLVSSGRLKEASESLKTAIQLNPDDDKSSLQLGHILTEQNLIDEAIDCYRTACRLQIVKQKQHLANAVWRFEQPRKPDFTIIGAAKAGTTSLYHYLIKHPKILPAAQKELDFFSSHFKKGTSWYLAQFPPIIDGHHFMTGESSPANLAHPKVPKRMFEFLPHIKLVVILRNPSDRAISDYHMWVKYGQEKRSMREAIETEIKLLQEASEEDLKDGMLWYKLSNNYVNQGLYFYSLRRWLQFFSREQILVLKSEELYTEPSKVMKQVFNFLNLEDYQLNEYPNYLPGAYNNKDSKDEYERVYAELNNYFQPYNQKLEEYLEIKLDWQ